jgi:hypothetical protein
MGLGLPKSPWAALSIWGTPPIAATFPATAFPMSLASGASPIFIPIVHAIGQRFPLLRRQHCPHFQHAFKAQIAQLFIAGLEESMLLTEAIGAGIRSA